MLLLRPLQLLLWTLLERRRRTLLLLLRALLERGRRALLLVLLLWSLLRERGRRTLVMLRALLNRRRGSLLLLWALLERRSRALLLLRWARWGLRAGALLVVGRVTGLLLLLLLLDRVLIGRRRTCDCLLQDRLERVLVVDFARGASEPLRLALQLGDRRVGTLRGLLGVELVLLEGRSIRRLALVASKGLARERTADGRLGRHCCAGG